MGKIAPPPRAHHRARQHTLAVRISRQATRRMIENFLISGGYNIIAVPLALFGHATPLAAALAMSLSSITVSLNAMRLR